MTNAAQGRTAEARRARYGLDTYILPKTPRYVNPRRPRLEPQVYQYPERHYTETGFCEMALVWALSDMGIPRRVSLMLSQEQATAMLGATVRDRYVDSLIRKAVSRGN